MLNNASDAQNETYETLKSIFVPKSIKFTLIGGAACRVYGSQRPTKDLDIAITPYSAAMAALSESKAFILDVSDQDVTGRTCTQLHVSTGVPVDCLTGGMRINDRCFLAGGIVHDAIAIPTPSGFGDVLPLVNLVAMKVSIVVSAEASLQLGKAIRTVEKIEQDVRDVEALISVCKLDRQLTLGDSLVEQKYQEIYDRLIA